MDRIWLKQYEQGVPADVDTNQYTSIVQMLEESFKKYTGHRAFSNMGRTLTFDEIDDLSRRFASYLQNKLGLQSVYPFLYTQCP